MHGENLRKFTEIRAGAPRGRHALISPRPRIQYGSMVLLQSTPRRLPQRGLVLCVWGGGGGGGNGADAERPLYAVIPTG
jgi:hypothetical protein